MSQDETSGEITATSTKPYILRGLYEWCEDNNFTPHIAVLVDESVQVPMEYVQNGQIILNIAMQSTHNLDIGNEYISFEARFNQVAHEIFVPVGNVLAIFARETGQGMVFQPDIVAPAQTKEEEKDVAKKVEIKQIPAKNPEAEGNSPKSSQKTTKPTPIKRIT